MSKEQINFDNFIKQQELILATQNAARLAEESNFTQQLKKQLLNNEVSDSKSIRGLRRMEKVNKFIDIIKNFFGGLFGWMFRSEFPLAHYITLLIVILIFMGYFGGGSGGAAVPNFRVIERTSNFIANIIRKIKAFFKKIFGYFLPSSYRVNLISNLITPFGSKQIEGIKRVKNNGRCDMIQWRQSGGFCEKTTGPKSIQWVIDPENLPEISELPEDIIKKITEKKMEINIPYTKVGTKYIPDCNNMKFLDGSKANLFIQKNIKDSLCRFIEKPSKKYNNTAIKRDSKSTDVYKLCK